MDAGWEVYSSVHPAADNFPRGPVDGAVRACGQTARGLGGDDEGAGRCLAPWRLPEKLAEHSRQGPRRGSVAAGVLGLRRRDDGGREARARRVARRALPERCHGTPEAVLVLEVPGGDVRLVVGHGQSGEEPRRALDGHVTIRPVLLRAGHRGHGDVEEMAGQLCRARGVLPEPGRLRHLPGVRWRAGVAHPRHRRVVGVVAGAGHPRRPAEDVVLPHQLAHQRPHVLELREGEEGAVGRQLVLPEPVPPDAGGARRMGPPCSDLDVAPLLAAVVRPVAQQPRCKAGAGCADGCVLPRGELQRLDFRLQCAVEHGRLLPREEPGCM